MKFGEERRSTETKPTENAGHSQNLQLFLKAAKLQEHPYQYIIETDTRNLVKTVQSILRTQNQIIHSLNQVIDHLLETVPDVQVEQQINLPRLELEAAKGALEVKG